MELIKIETTNARIEELKGLAKELGTLGVIAGGAVLDSLLSRDYKDIDVFFTNEAMSVQEQFVKYAQANGTVFETVGDGQYSEVAFAQSGVVEMFGKKHNIELINKELLRLVSTIQGSLRLGSPENSDRTKRAYDVPMAADAFINKLARQASYATAMGDLVSMNQAYGTLLIHEFDLDIKQVMIDPVTLDVLATPAFIRALESQTVNFSEILIHGEGITRRNLVRILDAANKYDLRLAEEEKIRPFLEAMKSFHTTLPTSTGDYTLVTRFYNNFKVPFLVQKSGPDKYESLGERVTSQSTLVSQLHPLSVETLERLDFHEVAVTLFDQWIRASFKGTGTATVVNYTYSNRTYSLSDSVTAIRGFKNLFAGTKFGEFLDVVVRAQKLFEQDERVVKMRSNVYEVDKYYGVRPNPGYEIAFSEFAPCIAHFCNNVELRGLAYAIDHISSTIITTASNHRAYSKGTCLLSQEEQQERNADMSSYYDFSRGVNQEVMLFDLFPEHLTFNKLDEYREAAYFNMATLRKNKIRTAFLSTTALTPQQQQEVRTMLEENPAYGPLSLEYPNADWATLQHIASLLVSPSHAPRRTTVEVLEEIFVASDSIPSRLDKVEVMAARSFPPIFNASPFDDAPDTVSLPELAAAPSNVGPPVLAVPTLVFQEETEPEGFDLSEDDLPF